jgi:hypothetical protein
MDIDGLGEENARRFLDEDLGELPPPPPRQRR